MYTINPTLCATRYGAPNTYSHYEDGPCPDVRRRCHELAGTYCLISLIGPRVIIDTSDRPNRLLATLASWENSSLWKHLRVGGGIRDWIISGLMRGSFVIGRHGSYMPHLANNVCAYASVIYCSHTKQFADVT